MPIAFTCTHCGHQTQVAEKYVGHVGSCVQCGGKIRVEPPVSAKAEGRSSSRGKLATAIVSVVLLLVVAVGGAGAIMLVRIQSQSIATPEHCVNNLKQIGVALQNYHDFHDTFPPAYLTDENGESTHGWRTLILPYAEQQALYDQFDLDKPWHDEENLLVADSYLPIYQCPDDYDVAAGSASYVLVTGPGAAFEGAALISKAQITDGLANTIAVVELAASDIAWADPRDLDVEEFVAMFGPAGEGRHLSTHEDGLHVLMCDGSVRFLKYDEIDQQTARALVSRAGGEVLNLPPMR